MKLTEKNARFAVVRTAFHRGGTVSFHVSLQAAERRVKRLRGVAGRACGCCEIVPVTIEAREEMEAAVNEYGYEKYPPHFAEPEDPHLALYHQIPDYTPDRHYSEVCR